MKKLILFLFILSCFNAIGQNPSNYQYRPVRERSVAQMVDSTQTLPRYNSVPSGLRVGSSANSGHVAIDTIGNAGFFYSEGKWRAFGSQGFETRLVNGGKVTWDSLLVFSVAPAIYYINGAYYTSSQTYLTLDAANGALDRIDLIYLDSTGAHKETGVAAATPEEPSLPANSIRLTAILIPATATVPGGGVDTVTIYDENVEWTVSTTSLTAPSTDNTSPFHFITDIQTGAITNTSILKFTSTTAINVSSFTALRFYLKLKGTFNNSTYLTVYFVKSGIKICIPIEIKNGTYGFSRTNVSSYQQITIPISDFGFTSTAADGLWFQPSGSNSSGFYMDWVQLQGGISQPVPSNTYTANLPIRITNNVISADTSRALAPSLATNAIVKKQIDSIAGLIITPTLQQVFNTETGGSVLTKDDTISTGAHTLKLITSTASANPLYVSAGTGDAIDAVSTSGYGVNGQSTNVSGVYGASQNFHGVEGVANGSGNGVNGTSISGAGGYFIVLPSSTNTVVPVIVGERQSQGTGANGIGGSLQFKVQTDVTSQLSNEIISKWTNATNGSRSSQMTITGVGTASTNDIVYLEGDKRTRFNGRAQMIQGADVASLNGAIALGYDGNIFEITGTNAITLITGTDWQNGSEITLIFTSTASLTDGTANSGSDIGMELAGNTNFTATADDTITLILCEIGGVQRWREKCRSVN